MTDAGPASSVGVHAPTPAPGAAPGFTPPNPPAPTLADLTTLRVGGPARRILAPATRDDLVAAALEIWSGFDEWLVLGGGSNVVVSDDGIDGDVLRVVTRGIVRPETGLQIEAGEPWDAVVAHAVANGLAGIEALSGIPGTTGAAPIQNIGAYGQELGDALVAIDFLDFGTGEVERLAASDLGLGYRTSALKTGRLGIVLGVELALAASVDGRDGQALSQPVAYDQLARALGVQLGTRVPLTEVRAAVLALRASKGMLLDAADPDSVSAGSFFTNPIVSENFARGLPSDAPRWPTEPERPPQVVPLGAPIPAAPASGEYQVKLSAAWLIERAGISRGFSLPGSTAAISSKHTLSIITRGRASARDVTQLANFVQTRVMSEFGVMLQPEPVLVGVSL